jgi:hypothetical protein
VFEVQGQDTSVYLCWGYLLGGGSSLGYDPYAALEWNRQAGADSLNFSTLDTIVVTAKGKSPLGLSVQLITSDITDYNFFEDSISLTLGWQEFRLPVKSFKRRFGGSGNLDIAKITAIRFQVQNKDNSAGEIHLKRMLFTGSFASAFKSPPPYLAPPISIRDGSGKVIGIQTVRMISGKNGCVRFSLPAAFKTGEIRITDARGTELQRLPVAAETIVWDGRDRGNVRLRSGMYFAAIKGRSRAVHARLLMIKP